MGKKKNKTTTSGDSSATSYQSSPSPNKGQILSPLKDESTSLLKDFNISTEENKKELTPFTTLNQVTQDLTIGDSRESQIEQIEQLKKTIIDQKHEHENAKKANVEYQEAIETTQKTHTSLKRVCLFLFFVLLVQQIMLMLKQETPTITLFGHSLNFKFLVSELSAKQLQNVKLAEENSKIVLETDSTKKKISEGKQQLEILKQETKTEQEKLSKSQKTDSKEIKKLRKQLEEKKQTKGEEVKQVEKQFEDSLNSVKSEFENLYQTNVEHKNELYEMQNFLIDKTVAIEETQGQIEQNREDQTEQKNKIDFAKQENVRISQKIKDKKIIVQFVDTSVPPIKLQQIVKQMTGFFLDKATADQIAINPSVSAEAKIEEEVAIMVWLDAYSENSPAKITSPCQPKDTWNSYFGRDCLLNDRRALLPEQKTKIEMLTQVFKQEEGVQVYAMCNFKNYFEKLKQMSVVPYVPQLADGILQQIKDITLVKEHCN